MENPVATQFIGKVMSFKTDDVGDEVCDDLGILEVTDAGEGFAEVAFNYGDERVYLGFRVSDLLRAIKEQASVIRTPIPNCPQPETPIRDRAWTDEQIRSLECVSDKIRKGEPASFFEAIATINYQKDLREKREANRWHRRFWRWCKSAIGATS